MAFIKKYPRTNFRRYATFHFHIRFDSAFVDVLLEQDKMIIDLFIWKLLVRFENLSSIYRLGSFVIETLPREGKYVLDQIYIILDEKWIVYFRYRIETNSCNAVQDRDPKSTLVPSGRVPARSTRKPRLKINELELVIPFVRDYFYIWIRLAECCVVKRKINFTRVTSFPWKIHTILRYNIPRRFEALLSSDTRYTSLVIPVTTIPPVSSI